MTLRRWRLVLVTVLVSGLGLAGLVALRGEPGSRLAASPLDKQAVREDLDSLLVRVEEIHPAPFAAKPRDEWTARAAAIVGRAPMSYGSFYAEVLGLISLARDGHTDAYPADSMASVRAALPIKFLAFPEGLYVVSAAPEYASLPGAEILEIEGRRASDALQRLRSIVPSDNPWGKRELLEDYVRMPALLRATGVMDERPGLQLTARIGGATRTVSIDPGDAVGALPVGPPRRPPPEGWIDARETAADTTALWQRHLERPYWYEELPKLDALYLQMNRVTEVEDGDFARFVDDLPKPAASGLSRLILDLRTNRGGDATLVQPLVHAVLRHWEYLEPGVVFVLTSTRTFSAAVHLAADLERNTHAVFVGEPTGAPPNHHADVRVVSLPNSGLEVEISSLYWQKSDPRDLRRAIHPDIEVELTWYDLVQGRDPALEAIGELRPTDPRLRRDRGPVFNWLRDTQP